MKLIRFLADAKERLGVLSDRRACSLEEFPFAEGADMNRLIDGFDDARLREIETALPKCPSWPLENVRLLSPIARPVHDILCVGVNYRAHFEECAGTMEMAEPPGAVYFSKRANRILGPGETIESHASLDPCLDYEVELAVIIGREGRDIPPEQVKEYIFGYSVFNDVSARTLQKHHVQWFRGKSLDTFCALGPVIVHRDELAFPPEVEVSSRVNGETRQSSNTRMFIRNVAELVSELSKGCTLAPGDIIATGTPSGVGMGFDPPRYMKPGDVVECEIQGIGILRNPIG